MKPILRVVPLFAAAALVIAACGERSQPAAPELALEMAADHVPFTFVQHVTVCSEGADATYDVSEQDAGGPPPPPVTSVVSIADGSCAVVARWNAGDPNLFVTVTQQPVSGFTLAGSQAQAFVGNDRPGRVDVENTPSITKGIGNDVGWVFTYMNDPIKDPCPGDGDDDDNGDDDDDDFSRIADGLGILLETGQASGSGNDHYQHEPVALNPRLFSLPADPDQREIAIRAVQDGLELPDDVLSPDFLDDDLFSDFGIED